MLYLLILLISFSANGSTDSGEEVDLGTFDIEHEEVEGPTIRLSEDSYLTGVPYLEIQDTRGSGWQYLVEGRIQSEFSDYSWYEGFFETDYSGEELLIPVSIPTDEFEYADGSRAVLLYRVTAFDSLGQEMVCSRTDFLVVLFDSFSAVGISDREVFDFVDDDGVSTNL